MRRRSASSPRARSPQRNGVASNASSWRPNPYAKRLSSSDRRLLAMKALAAELGPEFAVLAPDVAEAFPDSKAVNAALRAVLEAAKTVRRAAPRRRTRAA